MTQESWDLRDFAQGGDAGRLGRAPRAYGFVLLVLTALVVGGVLWASWAVIEKVARADGRVVPSGLARTVESLEGGIIREILVDEGDEVSSGQVLIQIDDTGSGANLGELQAQSLALMARAHRLRAEAEERDVLLFDGTETDPESPLALREIALFDNRRASYQSQVAVLQAQIKQRQQEIADFDASLMRVDETLALLDEEIELRSESGVVSRAQILPLERERTGKRQERDSVLNGRAQAAFSVDEAAARLEELRLQRRAEISAERSDTLNQLTVIEESIKRASDVVFRADLRAPVDGVISALNVNTIGAVIAPGEEVLRIVPVEGGLQVEARVRPEDIAFVRPDLPARVKLTSFDFTVYGALEGEVTRVGADAEQDETTGQIYFPIIVQTQSNTLERNGETLDVRPGMVASVDILTGEETVLEYLLRPFRKARYEALRER